jgi:hypothetical protein
MPSCTSECSANDLQVSWRETEEWEGLRKPGEDADRKKICDKMCV